MSDYEILRHRIATGIIIEAGNVMASDVAEVHTRLTEIEAQLASLHSKQMDIRDYDGNFAAAFADAPNGGTLYVPAGTYALSVTLLPPSNMRIIGAGKSTIISFKNVSRGFDLTDKMFVRFEDMRVHVEGSEIAAFVLSNSFRNSWSGVSITGTNDVGSLAPYTQRGILFIDNAGDNRLVDCDLNNLGEAIRVNNIQNYLTACTIGSCRRGIVGGDISGATTRGGISVNNTTFVGTTGASEDHILVEGGAQDWWLSQVWFEKAQRAITVGNANGGAISFVLRDAHVSATQSCIDLQRAWQPLLENISFGNEAGSATPDELTINAAGVPSGVASVLRSAQAFDLPRSVFPPDWTVDMRNWAALPAATGFFGGGAANRMPANPDTSGATLAALETEVNELKAALRSAGLMSS